MQTGVFCYHEMTLVHATCANKCDPPPRVGAGTWLAREQVGPHYYTATLILNKNANGRGCAIT